ATAKTGLTGVSSRQSDAKVKIRGNENSRSLAAPSVIPWFPSLADPGGWGHSDGPRRHQHVPAEAALQGRKNIVGHRREPGLFHVIVLHVFLYFIRENVRLCNLLRFETTPQQD